MTSGALVWSGLAVALAAWLVVTTVAGPRRLPGAVGIVRWLCSCWLGRILALSAWAVAGWHLFCQRP
jgi:hypothetical protein